MINPVIVENSPLTISEMQEMPLDELEKYIQNQPKITDHKIFFIHGSNENWFVNPPHNYVYSEHFDCGFYAQACHNIFSQEQMAEIVNLVDKSARHYGNGDRQEENINELRTLFVRFTAQVRSNYIASMQNDNGKKGKKIEPIRDYYKYFISILKSEAKNTRKQFSNVPKEEEN